MSSTSIGSKGAVFVATYSRATDLDNCLRGIVSARGNLDIPLVVIHQIGFRDVEEILEKWKDCIQILIRTVPQGRTPLENINRNSFLGREICTNWLNADWSLGVEEDVEIAKDSFLFIREMYDRYSRSKYFRGVNLGSMVTAKDELSNKFTLQRYGLHGQAGMITRKTWNSLNRKKIMKKIAIDGLDSMMESYLKSGFMCTPVLSRYIDRGWNGTHMPRDSKHSYYKELECSFVDNLDCQIVDYEVVDFNHNWRADSVKFNVLQNLPLRARFFIAKKRAAFHRFRNS